MLAYAYEYPNRYQIIVSDGTEPNSFVYKFGKDQDIETSVTESIRLAELAVEKKQLSSNPTPITL
jgi:hypothetical protein